MKEQIVSFLESNYLLSQSQYGFKNKNSITLAIDGLVKFITEGLEESLDTYVSLFDLTKAFDCVSHEILQEKLSSKRYCSSQVIFREMKSVFLLIKLLLKNES